MAKAELGVLLQDLRGKAGNTVFAKSRDGIIVKPRVTPANPDTPAQQLVRENLTRAGAEWKTYGASTVQAWYNYAQTITKTNRVSSKKYHSTPFNAFVELTAKLLQYNPTATIPSTPPTASFVGDNISISAGAGTGKVTFTASAANSTDSVTEFLLQPLASATRKPQKGAYRSKGFFQFVPGTLTYDVTVPPGYYAAAYRFVNKVTGQASKLEYLAVQGVTLAIEEGGKTKPTTRKAA